LGLGDNTAFLEASESHSHSTSVLFQKTFGHNTQHSVPTAAQHTLKSRLKDENRMNGTVDYDSEHYDGSFMFTSESVGEGHPGKKKIFWSSFYILTRTGMVPIMETCLIRQESLPTLEFLWLM